MDSAKKASLTQCAALSCSTQFRDVISENTLVKIISGKEPLGHWWPYIEVFFNELPHKYIMGTLQENSIPLTSAQMVFASLPDVYQGKNFKELLHE